MLSAAAIPAGPTFPWRVQLEDHGLFGCWARPGPVIGQHGKNYDGQIDVPIAGARRISGRPGTILSQTPKEQARSRNTFVRDPSGARWPIAMGPSRRKTGTAPCPGETWVGRHRTSQRHARRRTCATRDPNRRRKAACLIDLGITPRGARQGGAPTACSCFKTTRWPDFGGVRCGSTRLSVAAEKKKRRGHGHAPGSLQDTWSRREVAVCL